MTPRGAEDIEASVSVISVNPAVVKLIYSLPHDETSKIILSSYYSTHLQLG